MSNEKRTNKENSRKDNWVTATQVTGERSQPTGGFLHFSAGDLNLTPVPPEYLKSFRLKRTANDAANEGEIEIYDPDMVVVDDALAALGHLGDMTFSYGWIDGRQSPEYAAALINYEPELTDEGGANLKIEFISSASRNMCDNYKPKSYKGRTISEIVEIIAKANKWKTKDKKGCSTVEETDILETSEEGKFEDKPDAKLLENKGVPDVTFIRDQLLPLATRKKEPKISGYKFFFDDEKNDNGESTIHFKPVDFDVDPERTYIRAAKDSALINFKFDVEGLRLVTTDRAPTVKAAGVEQATGKPIADTKKDTDSVSTKPKGRTVGGSCTQRKFKGTEHKEILEQKNKYRQDISNLHRFNATAEMLLDPTLKVLDVIKIIILTPKFKEHYASGNYVVLEIEDTWDGAAWTQSVTLIRSGAGKGTENASGPVKERGGSSTA